MIFVKLNGVNIKKENMKSIIFAYKYYFRWLAGIELFFNGILIFYKFKNHIIFFNIKVM